MEKATFKIGFTKTVTGKGIMGYTLGKFYVEDNLPEMYTEVYPHHIVRYIAVEISTADGVSVEYHPGDFLTIPQFERFEALLAECSKNLSKTKKTLSLLRDHWNGEVTIEK